MLMVREKRFMCFNRNPPFFMSSTKKIIVTLVQYVNKHPFIQNNLQVISFQSLIEPALPPSLVSILHIDVENGWQGV